jgi:hypothetical protein
MTFRTVLDCLDYICSGWKVLKEEIRDSSSVKAVVRVVASYLDGSNCKETAKKVVAKSKPMAAARIVTRVLVKAKVTDFGVRKDKEGNSAKKEASMEAECHDGSKLTL